jgi:hypothetical protein
VLPARTSTSEGSEIRMAQKPGLRATPRQTMSHLICLLKGHNRGVHYDRQNGKVIAMCSVCRVDWRGPYDSEMPEMEVS